MSGAEYALLGGILGTLFATLPAIAIVRPRRHALLQEDPSLRALQRHPTVYVQIFTACRSLQDALRDYTVVDRIAADGSDPILRQVLEILKVRAYEYCSVVDGRANPGLAYIGTGLEGKCLRLRDLLRTWLSATRTAHGDVATVRRGGELARIPSPEIRRLDSCDYQELRLERVPVVLHHEGDAGLISAMNKAAATVIRDLRTHLA